MPFPSLATGPDGLGRAGGLHYHAHRSVTCTPVVRSVRKDGLPRGGRFHLTPWLSEPTGALGMTHGAE